MSQSKEYTQDTVIKENVEPRFISSISRTGRVIYQDDFEGYTSAITEKWNQSQGTIALDTARPFRSKNAAKLTTAASVAALAEMARAFGPLPSQRIGVEFWWNVNNALADTDQVYININYFDGTNETICGIAYYFTNAAGNQKWVYENAAGSFVDVPTGGEVINYSAAFPSWNHFKITCDFGAQYFIALVSNKSAWSMKTTQCYRTASAASPQFNVNIGIKAKTATANLLYVDDFILTDQEP